MCVCVFARVVTSACVIAVRMMRHMFSCNQVLKSSVTPAGGGWVGGVLLAPPGRVGTGRRPGIFGFFFRLFFFIPMFLGLPEPPSGGGGGDPPWVGPSRTPLPGLKKKPPWNTFLFGQLSSSYSSSSSSFAVGHTKTGPSRN